MESLSIAHTKFNCVYHIVFIPKYRRKVMFGKLKMTFEKLFANFVNTKTSKLSKVVCVVIIFIYA
jgi:putative transposase